MAASLSLVLHRGVQAAVAEGLSHLDTGEHQPLARVGARARGRPAEGHWRKPNIPSRRRSQGRDPGGSRSQT